MTDLWLVNSVFLLVWKCTHRNSFIFYRKFDWEHTSWLTCIFFQHQFSSVNQLCLKLCDPVDCSMPDFRAHHQLQELAQTHVHWLRDAIQTPHPLCRLLLLLQSFPASCSFPMSQLFASGGQSIGSFSFSISPSNEYQNWFPLGWTGLISLLSKGLLRVISTPQFKSISSSALSFLYGPTLRYIHDYWKKP